MLSRGSIEDWSGAEPGRWALAIVEAFDFGILTCGAALDGIRFANQVAVEALRALGAEGERLPETLRAHLAAALADRGVVEQFTRAVLLPAPDGRGWFVRARHLTRSGGDLMVTLAPAVLRERDLVDALHARFGLSRRECDVVVRVRAGLRNREIAEELELTVGTVKQYLNGIFAALGVTSRHQLLSAIEAGFNPRSSSGL